MIKTEQQYKQACAKCSQGAEQLQKHVEALQVRGYADDEIECLTGPTARMLAESRRAIDIYRRLKGKDAQALQELPLNRQLIGLRIYQGISQSRLASILGITRAELAREEKNEYRDLTLERYKKILNAMGVHHIPCYVPGDWEAVEDARKKLKRAAGQGSILIIG
ncbi:MAG: helix-turn-helix transcriptional regulator [candidate division Zixibacteria bacterium]|nr:helix-turn-helix transcriptional regulator [candidate division Zixibacteria bacterium]